MTNKENALRMTAAQEYDTGLVHLLEELDQLEEFGKKVFKEIEHSFSSSYVNKAAKADLISLNSLVESFAKSARTTGAGALSSSSPNGETSSGSKATLKNVNALNEAKAISVKKLVGEKDMIKLNAQTAVLAARQNQS